MLNLRTDGRPSPTTALFKKIDGIYVLFNSERFTVTLLGITISSVESEDVGEYKLSATYETHFDEEEFTIIVTSKFDSYIYCTDKLICLTYHAGTYIHVLCLHRQLCLLSLLCLT